MLDYFAANHLFAFSRATLNLFYLKFHIIIFDNHILFI